MSASVLERPAEQVCAGSTSTFVRRITRVGERKDATHVVKQGGRLPLYLVLADGVTGGELRDYCTAEMAWRLDALGMSVDGKFHNARSADVVLLSSAVRSVEFRARTSGHG